MFFLDLIDRLEEQKVPYVVVGGYALALHGIVRATMDIDLVVSLQEGHLRKTEEILQSLGLQSRIPVGASEMAQFHKQFFKGKNLVAWSFVHPADPTRVVDILIDPPLSQIKRTRIKTSGRSIVVAQLESLLIMKKKAGRPIDLIDIQRIEEHLRAKKKK